MNTQKESPPDTQGKSLPDELARFLALASIQVVPKLQPEEAAAVASAQVLYDYWEAEGGKFSKPARIMRRQEIENEMSRDPSRLVSLAGELAALESDSVASAAMDNARLGKVRAAYEVQALIVAAYDREINLMQAHLAEISAINLSQFGLSGQVVVERISGALNGLTASREMASRDMAPTVGWLLSPRRMACGFST